LEIVHPEGSSYAVKGNALVFGAYKSPSLSDDTGAFAAAVLVARQPPLADHNTSRVVVHRRHLPFAADLSPAEHMLEVAAREVSALRVHPGAWPVSLSSHAWNLYVPQSSGG